jgi:DNA-binding phage protein
MPKTVAKKATRTRTMPYDVAAQLRTPKEMAAYLDAWLADAPEDAARQMARPSLSSEMLRSRTEACLWRERLSVTCSMTSRSNMSDV